MAQKKKTGFSADFQEQIMEMTKDSPLLLAGTVMKRMKRSGTNDRGDWTLYSVEVRGLEGRTAVATLTDPATCPPLGEFVMLPIFVTKDGHLRESKTLETETF